MNKSKFMHLQHIFNKLAILLCFIILTLLFFYGQKKNGSYCLFVEFSDAYGVREGTSVTMRGVNIGYVKAVKLNINYIVVLLNIQSKDILIPKHSVIETNQVGLFNNTVIDIVPMTQVRINNIIDTDVFAYSCSKSNFLCHNNYIQGYRGLNYDDLIRAATRISQRFDDPRFFQIFYLCLRNFIDISDEIGILTNYISYIIRILLDLIDLYLVKYIL